MRKTEEPNLLAQMGYETRDIILRPIMTGIASLFVFIALTLVVSVGIYQFFIPDFAKLGRPPEVSNARRLPPHPQIQAEPKRDMEIFRQAEDAVLSLEAPDADGSKAAMKIDDAISVLATQQGIAGVKGDKLTERGTSGPGRRTATQSAVPSAGGAGHPEGNGHSDGGHGGETGGH
jgi:hypothetical protein